MRTHPFFNAAGAAAYIGAIVLFLNFLQTHYANRPDTLIDGMGALSLLVFSAAVMAYLFFYQPVALLIEGKKPEAASYFLTTLGIFGAIMVAIFLGVTLI